MKKINISFIILTLSIFLFSCNKDKISTNNPKIDNSLDSLKKNYYIEYKDYPIICTNSLLKINQCVVSFHPKRDSTYLQILITGNYIGNATAFNPQITIKGIGVNGKVLFEEKSFVNNIINGKRSQYNELTNRYLNRNNQQFVSATYLNLNNYKNEYKFSISDIEKFEVIKLDINTFFDDTLATSPIRLDTISIQENTITKKFTNIGLNNILFNNNLIMLYMIDNKGTVFWSEFGIAKPVLNYSPNQQGNFIVNNVDYNNVILKDVIVAFEADIDTSKSKSIMNKK